MLYYKLNVKRDLIEARGASIKALKTGKTIGGDDDIDGLLRNFESNKDSLLAHRGTVAAEKEYA